MDGVYFVASLQASQVIHRIDFLSSLVAHIRNEGLLPNARGVRANHGILELRNQLAKWFANPTNVECWKRMATKELMLRGGE